VLVHLRQANPHRESPAIDDPAANIAHDCNMSAQDHSYGPTCAFYEEDIDEPLPYDAEPPSVRAQFFYISSLPIDDPLSPLPPIQADQSHHTAQPFSTRDNASLEEAWLGSQRRHNDGEQVRPSSRQMLGNRMYSFPKFKEGIRSDSPGAPSLDPAASPTSLRPRGGDPRKKHGSLTGEERSIDLVASGELATEPDISNDGQASTRPSKELPRRAKQVRRSTSGVSESDVMLSQTKDNTIEAPVETNELQRQRESSVTSASTRRKHSSPFRRRSKIRQEDELPTVTAMTRSPTAQDEYINSDISGRPFARAPSTRNIHAAAYAGMDEEIEADRSSRSVSRDKRRARRDKSADYKRLFVPVGVSKLHLVELPDLVMKPIYWSPINDTSKVVRATWFYKDTMLPVPASLANRLESGYEYIRPYADSYQDELQACIENGASAEMKVVHRLWDDHRSSRPPTGIDKIGEEPINIEQTLPEQHENAAADPTEVSSKRMFETHSVIYIDRTNAQILRPSLLPSVAQKRRPLSSLRKGRQIGVAVVRGFDRKAWLKLHPDPKINEKAAQAKVGAYLSQSGDATTRGRRASCSACDDRYNTPVVSDLVLVIHGIGQKLSERMDSFHFTHAINGLRRDFNVELASEAVKGTLKSNTGMMVLPVNWRLTVDFDESKDENPDENRTFGLENITPDTLPAVRSIISDVMLDIPYYLSHHKEKMTSAVIREANRVYRLWCRNNPGFRESGRVHIVAHSLGSVMAMEILSRQPTNVSLETDIEGNNPGEKEFEFDTTNLFCCGSPCGFFLLLNNARLTPRAGRSKAGMEAEASSAGIATEARYGCPAVDNMYNVLNRNDPISYLMNASVDATYAASLQPANVPSASQSFFSRMGSSLRWASNIVPDPYSASAAPERPQVAHMPSTVELETHNFTREEIAEKRMYLLNENGQIDYHLASGGGPLEIQYLSMLSAHSSYWISKDFVKFLVVEIGRKSGKTNTIPVLRAVKKREWRRGQIA
jgi:hypothetical protein